MHKKLVASTLFVTVALQGVTGWTTFDCLKEPSDRFSDHHGRNDRFVDHDFGYQRSGARDRLVGLIVDRMGRPTKGSKIVLNTITATLLIPLLILAGSLVALLAST